jgi:hypothetical protein
MDIREDQPFYSISIHPTTGAISSVATQPETSLRYLLAHDWIPGGKEKNVVVMSEEQVRELAASVVDDQPETWERALILLAHHKSQLATDLIQQLQERAPEELQGFCELAHAESLSWLGYNYVSEPDGRKTVAPVGVEIPEDPGLPS